MFSLSLSLSPEGQSERWNKERARLDEHLDRRRLKYLEKQRQNFTGPGASSNFHRNVKAFGQAERPKAFDIRDLCPGMSDREVADSVADYFNTISREFTPLAPGDVPATYHRDLDLLSEEQVEKMIKSAKKPKSTVKGDIPPGVVNRSAQFLKIPVASIYNSIIKTNVWPIAWKREYVTVIPKKSIPSGFQDLRNISCTPLLSKIFEAHMLSRIEEETGLKNNQYGGVKRCSTTHMVVEMLQEMCENAEDYRTATAITAIDYSKAFNRLSYQHCLEAFRKKGASTPVIRILASFLTNRTMSVRVGQEWSEPLDVNGGCPQGSVLGVRLFNATTDDLEDEFEHLERDRLRLPSTRPPLSPPAPAPDLGGTRAMSSTPTREDRACELDIDAHSPIVAGAYMSEDPDVSYKPLQRNLPQNQPVLVSPPVDSGVGTQVLTAKVTKVFKYIDDNIICEKLNFGTTPISPGPPPLPQPDWQRPPRMRSGS